MPIRVRIAKGGQKKHQAWFRHRGQIIAKTFDRANDARAWEVAEKERLRIGAPVIRRSGLTLEDFAQDWLVRYKSEVKHCTYDAAIKRLRTWIVPELGRFRLDEIQDVDLLELREKVLEAGRSPRTANYVLTVLSKMYNDAVDVRKQWRLRLLNPAAGIKALPLALKSVPYWEENEASVFLKTAQSFFTNDFALYFLLLHTGVRIGEALAGGWDQMWFPRESFEVRRNVDWSLSEIVATTKSHELRIVGLGGDTLDVMQEHRSRSRKLVDSLLIFPNEVGKLRLLSNLHDRSFDKCIRKAGVRRITVHDLRHTFAAHYVMKGGSIYDLKNILGHANIKVTERYAHLSPEYIRRRTPLVGFNLGTSLPSPDDGKRAVASPSLP